MTVRTVLEPLIAAGIQVAIRPDGRLLVSPEERITPTLDTFIRDHLDELTAEARIDAAIRACWLRIDVFWPRGMAVNDQKLIDLEECLHIVAGEHDVAVVTRVLAAYEARARTLVEASIR